MVVVSSVLSPIRLASKPSSMADIWMILFDRAVAKKYKKNYYAQTLHPNLEFTCECERDGNLTFLDMLVTRKNSSISTTWYSKPMDTGLTLGFHACAPTRYKRKIIEGTIHRINQATSAWMGFHEGLEKAVRDWEANQYPPAFYIPLVRDIITKICQLETPRKLPNYNTKESVNGRRNMVILQYRGRSSDSFAKTLRTIIEEISTVFTTRKLKTHLPSLKDPIPESLCSRVVY